MIKTIVIILIILLFGIVGYLNKNKYKQQKEFLVYLNSFINYYRINIDVYKNDMLQIIEKYKLLNNDKSAKFDLFLRKNNKIIVFNAKMVEIYIYDEMLKDLIETYFNGLGKNNIEYEIESCKKINEIINFNIEKTENDIKIKGELSFKIWLAVGVIIAILVW